MPSITHRPRRRFGQNFLVDRSAARRIVDAAELTSDDAVLEIGPGRGVLTDLLVELGTRIAAVEIDRDLAAPLRDRYDSDVVTIVEADILEIDLREITERLGLAPEARLVVVGNLPYNISKPLALRLVEQRAHVARAVLMFQREVADRLIADPRSKAYGALTVLTRAAYDIERRFDLPPAAFRPRPKVRSTVTAWVASRPDRLADDLDVRLAACLRACFGHRRRTLRNNLRGTLPGGNAVALDLLGQAGIDPEARAETISVERFLELAAIWPLEEATDGTGSETAP